MRRKFVLSDEQEFRLMNAGPDGLFDVWEVLGFEMGFKPETVEVVPGEASQFTAEDSDDIPRPGPEEISPLD